MKIAFSSTGKDMTSTLDPRFGRCAYFVFYDKDTGEFEAVENDGVSASGGAGIAAAQQIINNNVDVLITGAVGPNAFNGLKASGIKVYKCGQTDLNNALHLLGSNKLEVIDAAGRAHAGM